MTIQKQQVTIAASASVSGDIKLQNAKHIAIGIPSITSCQIFLQGAFDTTSADMRRMLQEDGSGDFAIDAGVGSRTAIVNNILNAIPVARIETSVPQEAEKTFDLIYKI